ncbi:MAG: hypothetical protein N2643_03800 [Endomicrobia bacterium]|nr:hypothetical protein [Endomicrobiia bacterium]
MKNLLLFLLIFGYIEQQLYSKDIKRYKYFAECARLDGLTGKIYSINTNTTAFNKMLLSIYRFDLSLNYGITRNSEVGFKLNLNEQQDISKFSKNITYIFPYVKYHIISSYEKNPIDISLGFYRTNGFIVIEKIMPDFYATSFVLNLFLTFLEKEKFSYNMSFSKYTKWIEFIVDMNLSKNLYAVGIRGLLTPDIRLGLFLTDLKNLKNLLFYNFIFGISMRM